MPAIGLCRKSDKEKGKGKHCVWSSDKKKLLGRHTTKAAAMAQFKAVIVQEMKSRGYARIRRHDGTIQKVYPKKKGSKPMRKRAAEAYIEAQTLLIDIGSDVIDVKAGVPKVVKNVAGRIVNTTHEIMKLMHLLDQTTEGKIKSYKKSLEKARKNGNKEQVIHLQQMISKAQKKHKEKKERLQKRLSEEKQKAKNKKVRKAEAEEPEAPVEKDLYWLYADRKLIRLGEKPIITYLRSNKTIKSRWAAGIRLHIEDSPGKEDDVAEIFVPKGLLKGKRQLLENLFESEVPKHTDFDPKEVTEMFSDSVQLVAELYIKTETLGWLKIFFLKKRYNLPYGRIRDMRGKIVPSKVMLEISPQVMEQLAKVPPWLLDAKTKLALKNWSKKEPAV